MEGRAHIDTGLQAEMWTVTRDGVQSRHGLRQDHRDRSQVTQNIQQRDEFEIGVTKTMRCKKNANFDSELAEVRSLLGPDVDWKTCNSPTTFTHGFALVATWFACTGIKPVSKVSCPPSLFAEIVAANPPD